MDAHIAESSGSRGAPNESEERLRKKSKKPKERNYGVSFYNLKMISCKNLHAKITQT